MKKESKNTLLTLTTAALTLPGMTPQFTLAQSGLTTDKVVSYRFMSYSEEAIPQSLLGTGPNTPDGERYEIDLHHLRFKSAITEITEIGVDFQSETLSGASPWYVTPSPDGPVQVLSGATIEEKRNKIDVAFTTYGKKAVSATGVSYSKENDYSSFGLRSNYTWLLNDKNTTLEDGFSLSQDFIDATQDPNSPNPRPTDEDKTSTSFTLGFSQILSKTSLMSSSINLATFSGFMSDPYKLVTVGTDRLPDSRPDRRNQWAWSNRYRKDFPDINGAFHFDYRYFGSNWETESHTFDMRWYQNFGENWLVSPSIRYYSQDSAVFFSNWYDFARADGFHSSDYRLSKYDAVSTRLKVTRKVKFGAVHLLFEDYASDAISKNPQFASPGLVDFSYFSIGFDYKF